MHFSKEQQRFYARYHFDSLTFCILHQNMIIYPSVSGHQSLVGLHVTVSDAAVFRLQRAGSEIIVVLDQFAGIHVKCAREIHFQGLSSEVKVNASDHHLSVTALTPFEVRRDPLDSPVQSKFTAACRQVQPR